MQQCRIGLAEKLDKRHNSRFAPRLLLVLRKEPSFAGGFEATISCHKSATPHIAKRVRVLHESKLTGYDHAVLDMHLSAQARRM